MNNLIRNSYRIASYIFLLVTIGFLLYGLLLYQTDPVDLIKYLLFQVFFIFLQGSLFIRLIRLNLKGIERVVYSYGLGIVITILEYFVCFSLHFDKGIFFIGIVVSIIESVIIFKVLLQKKYNPIHSFLLVPLPLWNIFSIILMVTLFGFILYNPLPNVGGTVTFNQDLLWNIGNMESAQRGFPMEDSRVAGVPLYYHYFGSIHLAVMSLITGIEPTELFFKFSQLGKAFLIVFSAFLLGKNFFRDTTKGLWFTWIFFFTSCASLNKVMENGYGTFLNINFLHITVKPIGFQFSISFLFLAAVILLKQFRETRLQYNLLITFTLLSFFSIGTKGPVGLVLVGVVLAIMFISLILKKDRIRQIAIYALSLSVLFIGTYLTFIKNSTSSLGFQLGYTVRDTAVWKNITEYVTFGKNEDWLIVPAIFVHLFLFLPFAMPLFVFWLADRIKSFNRLHFEELLVGGLAICGICGTLIFKQDGHSELYFILTAIPFIELAALSWLFNNVPRLSSVSRFLICLLFLIGSYTTAANVIAQIIEGEKKVESVQSKLNYYGPPGYNQITSYENEAMLWLKEHSNTQDLMATNRHYYFGTKTEGTQRYFYYSTFSNRRYFLEGWAYYYSREEFKKVPKDRLLLNKKIFNNESDVEEILSHYKIKYIVASKFENPELRLTYDNAQVVFSNRDVDIYRVDLK
jgi:hypothetical protein